MLKLRRNKYNRVCKHQGGNFPPSQTTQQEPSLYDLLVRYQNGLDISSYVTTNAVSATANQWFTNRVGKTDFLTEIPEYITEVKRQEEVSKSKVDGTKKFDNLMSNYQPPEIDANGNEKVSESVQQNVQNETNV